MLTMELDWERSKIDRAKFSATAAGPHEAQWASLSSLCATMVCGRTLTMRCLFCCQPSKVRVSDVTPESCGGSSLFLAVANRKGELDQTNPFKVFVQSFNKFKKFNPGKAAVILWPKFLFVSWLVGVLAYWMMRDSEIPELFFKCLALAFISTIWWMASLEWLSSRKNSALKWRISGELSEE